ncbi:TonB-dependent receptor [Beijerinckia indica]|uniref:TonB-dependent receptor n=1 Tax=Beijerinckia indica subsp. indica (strain ATCC 9039 / DSM 1715 / NCIMB 8712) TaxID=395963 RepID=B2IBM3_BEII9|nr:TonB-dependent receptor [Beijerinckia indica]ACB96649.1 TonB-dependent receptor [Beijerinckia indica subsp. indica ATCC 9039]
MKTLYTSYNDDPQSKLLAQVNRELIAIKAERRHWPNGTRRSLNHCLAISHLWTGLCLSQSVLAQQASSTQATPSGAQLQVEDVQVIGSNQVDQNQNVPIPITTISASQIQATHVFNLRQIAAQVPSLQIQGFNPRNATLTIRGLGSNTGIVNSGLEQGVGIYIDGVYYARPAITVFDLWDLSGVEVLRGPQGTAFGKNATAGAINISTELPTFARTMKADFSVGNWGYTQFRGAVSSRIADSDFAFRLAGYVTNRNGNIYNSTHHEYWNDLHSGGVKAQILFEPSEDLRVRVIGDYNAQKEESGFSIIKQALPTTLANGSSVVGYYEKAARFPDYNAVIANPSDRVTPIDSDHTLVMNTGGISVQADAKIFDAHRLTSITAFRWWGWNSSLDGDSLGLPIQTAANLPTFQRQVSQEIRLASPEGGALDGHLDYTLGFFYFWQHNREHQYNAWGQAASTWYLGANAPISALNGLTSLGDISSTTNSYSGFGQATFHILPDFDLTAGLRYNDDVKNGTYNAWQGNNAVPIAQLPAAYQASAASLRNNLAPTTAYSAFAESGNFSGTAKLSYRFNDQLFGYASYAHGFIGPGLNLTPVTGTSGISPVVAPETVDSYEVGVKTDWLDHRLSLNANLFLQLADNYQASTYAYIGSRYVSYIGNVGRIRTRGFEIDSHAQITDDLTATFSATYNDATFLSYPKAQCPFAYSYLSTCDLSGQPLTGVSRFALFLGAEYKHSIGHYADQDIIGYIGGDLTYRSSFFSTLNDDPFGLVPAYSVIGLHAGFRTQDGNYDVAFWVKNLANTTYYAQISVGSSSAVPVATAILGDPRQVGMTISAKF